MLSDDVSERRRLKMSSEQTASRPLTSNEIFLTKVLFLLDVL